jgi:Asp-tRNA(Asn)/Glu-tRNA(Gln) amidotransferase A subunit family amidase
MPLIDFPELPFGLRPIGRPFDEETLFSLGEVVEQAAGQAAAKDSLQAEWERIVSALSQA